MSKRERQASKNEASQVHDILRNCIFYLYLLTAAAATGAGLTVGHCE